MQENVVGLLAIVSFVMPTRFAVGSTEGEPALTSLHRRNVSLGHPPPAAVTPSSPLPLTLYIVLVALVPKLCFLVPVCYIPVQVPVVGTHRPVGPVRVFPRSQTPTLAGHCLVVGLQTIWVPFSQLTISTGLLPPRALSPLPQLLWLKVLTRLLSLILHLGFLLQFILSCLPELAHIYIYIYTSAGKMASNTGSFQSTWEECQ